MPTPISIPSEAIFAASEPWGPQRPESLVICCSDGRWHAHVEQFVRSRVSARADLYAVPGGPAALHARSSSYYARKVAEDALDFLTEHHGLEFVWLIAHQDCAWYRARYEFLDADALARRQWDDLDAVASAIRQRHPRLAVHKVYAALDGSRVTFVETASGLDAPRSAAGTRPRPR